MVDYFSGTEQYPNYNSDIMELKRLGANDIQAKFIARVRGEVDLGRTIAAQEKMVAKNMVNAIKANNPAAATLEAFPRTIAKETIPYEKTLTAYIQSRDKAISDIKQKIAAQAAATEAGIPSAAKLLEPNTLIPILAIGAGAWLILGNKKKKGSRRGR